ncbi:MAG: 4Fe-4S dicluster domain-containing protein [Chloroflexi bacterium]|nr:4Fe-4S dicluster domain-containing protein [Chloroflexota bacterium]
MTKASRRRFLAGAAGLSAVAAGSAIGRAAPATAASEGSPASLTALREQNLLGALQERASGTGPGFGLPSAISVPVIPEADILPLIAEPGNDATLARMQEELARALEKPIGERRWTMAIDLKKCIGCSACTVACIAENHLPPGVVYRPVLEEESGVYPNVTRRFTPRPCMQCDEPPCVPVCPVSATYKRPDGVVEIDYSKCIGCRYCMMACPYAARYFDFGEHYTDGTPERQPYEESPAPEYQRDWSRESVEGVVRKCQFCVHRLNAGMLPACVATCIGGATYFGDGNDPESLVNELLASGRAVRLKEELGTKPKVFYLV